MENKKKTIATYIVGGLLLFLVSFGLSFVIVRYFHTQSVAGNLSSPLGSGEGVEQGPKDTPSPLNGALFTKLHAEQWSQRRPLAIMVENHVEARPQSGLSQADVIYEAVAEGGITRFMAIFFSQQADPVGPVRSARTYFLDWLSEYDALYAHVGGANTPGPANALGQIRTYGIKDMDQFRIGFPTYWRDYDRLPGVATEHTMYTSTEKLWQKAKDRGWGAIDDETGDRWDSTFREWTFKDDAPMSERPASQAAELTFWSGYGQYSVRWEYEKESNSYQRRNGGGSFIDKNTGEQLSAKTVIVQVMRETNAFDGYPGNVHLLYKTIGSGKAYILRDGQVIEGTWEKESRTARTLFKDATGQEVQLTRGLIWVTTLPHFGEIEFK